MLLTPFLAEMLFGKLAVVDTVRKFVPACIAIGRWRADSFGFSFHSSRINTARAVPDTLVLFAQFFFTLFQAEPLVGKAAIFDTCRESLRTCKARWIAIFPFFEFHRSRIKTALVVVPDTLFLLAQILFAIIQAEVLIGKLAVIDAFREIFHTGRALWIAISSYFDFGCRCHASLP